MVYTPTKLPFSTLIKPTGAACNLDCSYCFFLSKELLHEGSNQRMDDDALELTLSRFLDAHRVNIANADEPLRVYRHFRDELGAEHIQFIPIVEIFEQWLANDVGKVFVQHFEVAIGNYLGQYGLCVHAPTCGLALAVEFNGDVYSCDHFVEPGYELDNLREQGFQEMLQTPFQLGFGQAKRDSLTAQCRRCPVRWACHGGCPKDRFATSIDGEPGQNYLCLGYLQFFEHATPAVKQFAHRAARG